MEPEEFMDLAANNQAELERIKTGAMASPLYNEDLAPTPGFAGVFANPTFIESLYNYGLFFTFGVAAVAYLALSMIGGRATEPASEPETT